MKQRVELTFSGCGQDKSLLCGYKPHDYLERISQRKFLYFYRLNESFIICMS